MKKKSKSLEGSNIAMPSSDGPQKRSFSVNEAENGFTVNHSGGELGYQGKTHVFSSGDEVVNHLKKHIGAAKSDNPEKDRKVRQRAEAQAMMKEHYVKKSK